MKTDLYTKSVLTVIAICLIIIVLKHIDIIPNAFANTPKTTLMNNMNYGLVPLNADGSIDVNIKSSSIMDVNIESCSTTAFLYAEPIEVIISE